MDFVADRGTAVVLFVTFWRMALRLMWRSIRLAALLTVISVAVLIGAAL